MSEIKAILARGVWRENPALVQLLGLCPVLAVTTTVVNGLTLGLATSVVLIATNTLVSLMRRALVPVVRIPLFLLIIASLVTSIDLLMNALLFDLHGILGIFIPLIITNCAILAQAARASHQNLPAWAPGQLPCPRCLAWSFLSARHGRGGAYPLTRRP